ncbi:MAG TPA: LuxR C-terminal-related transcriptional regulator, partial [Gemmatimonadaceae bacterium]|nr:LuxR C-terminal-related transcriptional regulator [Gemmatimonadaceae bacterium]
ATVRRIEPLTRPDLAEMMQRAFTLPEHDAAHHAATLWSHTRGNPFFVEESLKALAASGRIRRTGVRWIVDDSSPSTLPPTVREAVRARLDTLGAGARRVVEIAAIVEGRAPLAVLERVSQLDALALADAIDELCSRRILVEVREGGTAGYEFGHPIIQSTLRGELTAARERALHVAIASALETLQGDGTPAHAMEIARHLVRAQASGSDERTLRYLAEAGRDAMVRRADQEAARWLGDALTLAERLGEDVITAGLLEDLATARLRVGDGPGATANWTRALQHAVARQDREAEFRLHLALAQDAARNGNASGGLERLVAGESVAAALDRRDLVIRARVARMRMLQVLGRSSDAAATIAETLVIAESLGNTLLLALVHQAASQLHSWTGPATVAREHGTRALALAAQCGDREIAWAAHWAMAMLEGFTGDADGAARHLHEAGQLADALASPELQAMTAEIAIEHASVVGQWDEALALAERTIPLARATMPNPLLPRLLVWTGLIVLERDETDRARALLQEAWMLSGAEAIAGDGDDGLRAIENVHNVILAHTGMGALCLSQSEWHRALEYLERGLALADRFGYVAWAIHRLLPLIIEARLRVMDHARVEALTLRLREQSAALNHRLGMAWAAAAEALVARMLHRSPDAAARLIAAADALNAVPFVFHAAKLRRNAAQVLEADGDVAGAVRELRSAHDVFLRLGAESELRGARSQLRALGVRLPPRTAVQGAGTLTGRELEIARAVARRLSNKEIGALLDISARTVSTHLSNIFEKLGVDSRGALADHVREHPLLGER